MSEFKIVIKFRKRLTNFYGGGYNTIVLYIYILGKLGNPQIINIFYKKSEKQIEGEKIKKCKK